MSYKYFLLLLTTCVSCTMAQHEDIPYQDVANICETCVCLSTVDTNKHLHQALNCAMKNFQHILARWPPEFGTNHNGIDIVATFSGNDIELLQQLPATNATLTFTCRHCGIKHLQVPTFMDVPNIERLDLSWNELKSSELTPDLFRGPFRSKSYEPIALIDLDFSHNQFHTLDKKQFEHTPHLKTLRLSHNQFNVLDTATMMALSAATGLEKLDLSYNGLQSVDVQIFRSLSNLNTLNLAGNKLHSLPTGLQLLEKSLFSLNFAENQVVAFNGSSFQGLTQLKYLNISNMTNLKTIGNGTFTHLTALELLHCAYNEKLVEFDLSGLLTSRNLTHLNLSHNALSMLTLSHKKDSKAVANSTETIPWPKMRVFEVAGNPWYCSCELLQTLEYIGNQYRQQIDENVGRCDTPYILAGLHLTNLTAEKVCSMQIPKKFRIIEEDPPRFLRRRYIILTAIIASIVMIIGLVVGFVVVCIRRRLKGDDFGIEPIRYTSVRGSNLSALSTTQAWWQPIVA